MIPVWRLFPVGPTLLVLLATGPALAQRVVNHEYPRLGHFSSGIDPVDWMSRFDVVVTSNSNSDLVLATRQINPDAYYLSNSDWGRAGPYSQLGETLPAEFALRTSAGVLLPLNPGTGQSAADVTDFCAALPDTGEKYNQALPRMLDEQTQWGIFDGLNSSGTGRYPWGIGSDIDLDRDGVNDVTAAGRGTAWIQDKWVAGQNTIWQNLRNRWAENQKILTYTFVTDTMGVSLANGVGFISPDHTPQPFSLFKSLADQWTSQGPQPRISWLSTNIRYDLLHAPARQKDYFRFMRFMLGWSLMTDTYFGITDDLGGNSWNYYYDEFDVKLGYPTGPAVQLASGAWVRFFDNGAAIMNPTSGALTIGDADLEALAGYAGPYFRFQGNQDPAWNNGQSFDQVTLLSTAASWNNSTSASSNPGVNLQNVGDAIVLVKTPKATVADIIVDNSYSGTSPGSNSAVFTAGWQWDSHNCDSRANLTWKHNTWDYVDRPWGWHAEYSPAGAGTQQAVFTPTINVSGQYEVFEWHGWLGSYDDTNQEATNVPVTIAHAQGAFSTTVNQQINVGKWNSLGTFEYTAGGDWPLTISDNANGPILADAFKFVYKGTSAPACMDGDGDGYSPDGGSCGALDCHDDELAVHPLAAEICGNNMDENCDGLIEACPPACGNGTCELDESCDHCTADCGACPPMCGNGICDPGEKCTSCPEDCGPCPCSDEDHDGFSVDGGACGVVDCNDANVAVYPGAVEICGNGVDEDCDGAGAACQPRPDNPDEDDYLPGFSQDPLMTGGCAFQPGPASQEDTFGSGIWLVLGGLLATWMRRKRTIP